MRLLQELRQRFLLSRDFVGHAVAYIEYQTDGERRILIGEEANLLLLRLIKEQKIILVQAEHGTIHRVGDVDRNQDEIRLDLDRHTWLAILAWRGRLGGAGNRWCLD